MTRRPESVHVSSRRPLAVRQAPWARSLAAALAARGVRPNWISGANVPFAAVAGVSLVFAGSGAEGPAAALYLLAAAAIQLRLLCSLLDGMVAIEGGRGTSRSGAVWNEVPDRFSDAIVLVSGGFSLAWLPWGPALGWVAALSALLVAYVRALGGALGFGLTFAGPMAKQHRMAVVTVGSVLAAVEAWLGRTPRAMAVALAIVVVGSAVTFVRRIVIILEPESERP